EMCIRDRYLLILLICLLTFNAKVIAIALLPLLAFIALKTAKNRSLRDGVQSVINLFMFSAGMLRGMARTVRDPMQRPAVTVFNPKHIDTENENSLR
ncbi:glycosyl transferase, partial [Enterobacter sp. 63]